MTRLRSVLRPAHGEQGSILLALLGVLVVSGLVVLLLGTTLREQSSARFDRSFTSAVQGADAGVQQALYAANSGQVLPSTARQVSLQGSDATTYWKADLLASDPYGRPMEYAVTSSSTVAGTRRTVTARLVQQPRFSLAAFAQSSVEMNGANKASSYKGQTPDTGRGRIGSNGNITYNGNASADGTDVYGYATASTGRCTGATCTSKPLATYDEPFDITSSAATSFMTQRLAACGAGPFPTWTASAHGYVLGPETTRGYHCFGDVAFDGDTTISGSPQQPVVVYATGTVSFSNQADVNVVPGVLPKAAALQVFSTGTQVRFGNHARVGAAIWAPLAHCGGNPSNAQTKVYGSLVCGSIANQGGWGFFYDEELAALGDGLWRVRSYGEPVGVGPVVTAPAATAPAAG